VKHAEADIQKISIHRKPGKDRVFYATEIIRTFCSNDNEYSKLIAFISQFSTHFNIFKTNTLAIF